MAITDAQRKIAEQRALEYAKAKALRDEQAALAKTTAAQTMGGGVSTEEVSLVPKIDKNFTVGAPVYLDVNGMFTTKKSEGARQLYLIEDPLTQQLTLTPNASTPHGRRDEIRPLVMNINTYQMLNKFLDENWTPSQEDYQKFPEWMSYLRQDSLSKWREANQPSSGVDVLSAKDAPLLDIKPVTSQEALASQKYQQGKEKKVAVTTQEGIYLMTPEERAQLNRGEVRLPGQYTAQIEMPDGSIQPGLLSISPIKQVDKTFMTLNRPIEQFMQPLEQSAKSNPFAALAKSFVNWAATGVAKVLAEFWNVGKVSLLATTNAARVVLSKEFDWEDWVNWWGTVAEDQKEIFHQLGNASRDLGASFVNLIEWMNDPNQAKFTPKTKFEAILQTSPITPGGAYSPSVPWGFEEAQAEIDKDIEATRQQAAMDEAILTQAANEYMAESLKIIRSGTNDPQKLEKATEATRKAIEIDMRLGYVTDRYGFATVNPYYAFSTSAKPEELELFIKNLVQVSLQKQAKGLGTHLSEFEVFKIKEMVFDPGIEMVGQMLFDWTNVIDFGPVIEAMKGVKGTSKLASAFSDGLNVLQKAAVEYDWQKAAAKALKQTSKTGKIFTAEQIANMNGVFGGVIRTAVSFNGMKTAIKSQASKEAAIANDVFTSIAKSVVSTDDFINAMDDVADVAKATVRGTVDEKLVAMPASFGAKQMAGMSEISKVINPDKWKTILQQVVDDVRNQIADHARQQILRTMKKAGRDTTSEAGKKALEDAVAKVIEKKLKPNVVVPQFADAFRVQYLNNGKIWRNSDILYDSLVGKLVELSGGVLAEPTSKFGQVVRWVSQLSNVIMNGWYKGVLSLRPAWVIRNYQDNVGRFVIAGGKFGGDLAPIIASFPGGVPPANLFQSMQSVGISDPTSPIYRVLNEGTKFKSFLDFYTYRIKEVYRGFPKSILPKKDLTVPQNIARSGWKILEAGVVNPFRVLAQGTGDWNSYVEFSFRVRLYHTKYTEGLAKLRPLFEAENLAKLPEDFRVYGKALLDASNNDPIRMSQLLKLQDESESVIFSYLIPDEVEKLLAGASPTDRQLFILPVQQKLAEWVQAFRANGKVPTDSDLKVFFTELIEQAKEANDNIARMGNEARQNPIDLSKRPTPEEDAGVLDEVLEGTTEKPAKVLPNSEARKMWNEFRNKGIKPDEAELLRVLSENGIEVPPPVTGIEVSKLIPPIEMIRLREMIYAKGWDSSILKFEDLAEDFIDNMLKQLGIEVQIPQVKKFNPHTKTNEGLLEFAGYRSSYDALEKLGKEGTERVTRIARKLKAFINSLEDRGKGLPGISYSGWTKAMDPDWKLIRGKLSKWEEISRKLQTKKEALSDVISSENSELIKTLQSELDEVEGIIKRYFESASDEQILAQIPFSFKTPEYVEWQYNKRPPRNSLLADEMTRRGIDTYQNYLAKVEKRLEELKPDLFFPKAPEVDSDLMKKLEQLVKKNDKPTVEPKKVPEKKVTVTSIGDDFDGDAEDLARYNELMKADEGRLLSPKDKQWSEEYKAARDAQIIARADMTEKINVDRRSLPIDLREELSDLQLHLSDWMDKSRKLIYAMFPWGGEWNSPTRKWLWRRFEAYHTAARQAQANLEMQIIEAVDEMLKSGVRSDKLNLDPLKLFKDGGIDVKVDANGYITELVPMIEVDGKTPATIKGLALKRVINDLMPKYNPELNDIENLKGLIGDNVTRTQMLHHIPPMVTVKQFDGTLAFKPNIAETFQTKRPPATVSDFQDPVTFVDPNQTPLKTKQWVVVTAEYPMDTSYTDKAEKLINALETLKNADGTPMYPFTGNRRSRKDLLEYLRDYNAKQTAKLKQELDEVYGAGNYIPVDGNYGKRVPAGSRLPKGLRTDSNGNIIENSFLIPGGSADQALDLGKRYNQDAVLTQNGFVYQNGKIAEAENLFDPTKVIEFDSGPNAKVITEYFSEIEFPGGQKIKFKSPINFDGKESELTMLGHERGRSVFVDTIRRIALQYQDSAGRSQLKSTNDIALANILKKHLKEVYPKMELPKGGSLQTIVDAMLDYVEGDLRVIQTPEQLVGEITKAFNKSAQRNYQRSLPEMVKTLKDNLKKVKVEQWGLDPEYVDDEMKLFDYWASNWAREKPGRSPEEWWYTKFGGAVSADARLSLEGKWLYLIDPNTGEAKPVWYSPLEKVVESGLTDKSYPDGMAVIKRLRSLPGIKKEELEITGVFDWLADLTADEVKRGINFFIHHPEEKKSLVIQELYDLYAKNTAGREQLHLSKSLEDLKVAIQIAKDPVNSVPDEQFIQGWFGMLYVDSETGHIYSQYFGEYETSDHLKLLLDEGFGGVALPTVHTPWDEIKVEDTLTPEVVLDYIRQHELSWEEVWQGSDTAVMAGMGRQAKYNIASQTPSWADYSLPTNMTDENLKFNWFATFPNGERYRSGHYGDIKNLQQWVRGDVVEIDKNTTALLINELQSDVDEEARDAAKHIRWDLYEHYMDKDVLYANLDFNVGGEGYRRTLKNVLPKTSADIIKRIDEGDLPEELRGLLPKVEEAIDVNYIDEDVIFEPDKAFTELGKIEFIENEIYNPWQYENQNLPRDVQDSVYTGLFTYVDTLMDNFKADMTRQVDEIDNMVIPDISENFIADLGFDEKGKEIKGNKFMQWLQSVATEDEIALMKAGGYTKDWNNYLDVRTQRIIGDWVKKEENSKLIEDLPIVEDVKQRLKNALDPNHTAFDTEDRRSAIERAVYEIEKEIRFGATEEELLPTIKKLRKLGESLQSTITGLVTGSGEMKPRYPFSKNYTEVAFKRMLRKAVDDGHGYLTWTTGEQQIKRWNNLRLGWEEQPDGSWKVFYAEAVHDDGTDLTPKLGQTIYNVKNFSDVRKLPGEIGKSWAETLWKEIQKTAKEPIKETKRAVKVSAEARPIQLSLYEATTPIPNVDLNVRKELDSLVKSAIPDAKNYSRYNIIIVWDSAQLDMDGISISSVMEGKAPRNISEYLFGIYPKERDVINNQWWWQLPVEEVIKKYNIEDFEGEAVRLARSGSYRPLEEGMVNFYDKEPYRLVEEWNKKYGLDLKVEDVSYRAGSDSKLTDTTIIPQLDGTFVIKAEKPRVRYVMDHNTGEILTFKTYEEAEEYIEAVNKGPKITVHGIKLTDKAREWAEGGLPLFLQDPKTSLKRAGTIFDKTGRGVMVGFLKAQTPFDSLHEVMHIGITDLTAGDWPVISKWLGELPEAQRVKISGDEFADLHRKYLDGTISNAEFKVYSKASENINNGIVKTLIEGVDNFVSPEVKSVLQRIVNAIKKWYEAIIGGKIPEVELTPEVRKVFTKLFDQIPDAPVPEVVRLTDDMKEVWKTFQVAPGADGKNWLESANHAQVKWEDPNVFLQSLKDIAATETDPNIADYYRTLTAKAEGQLKKLEETSWSAADSKAPPKRKKVLTPIPDAKLPLEYQSWLALQKESVTSMNRAIAALIAWQDSLSDSFAKAAKGEASEFFFSKQKPAFWKTMQDWADTTARDLQEMINTASYGGNYRGQVLRGAVPETNDAMLDYTNWNQWENVMRTIYPFWMFPSRSTVFWAKTLATHPAIAMWYQKYMMMSERQVYQEGLVTSRGEPLPSFRGYVKIAGTDIWFNPTAALSFRYVLNPLMGFTAGDNASVSDFGEEEVSPLVSVIRELYRVGLDYGFQPSPVFSFIPMVQEGLGVENTSAQTIIPMLELMPLNWRRQVVDWLRIKSPSIRNAIAAEPPWKNYLIENKMLKDALEKIMVETEDADRYATAIGVRTVFTTADSLGNPTRETNKAWLDARAELEKTQLWQKYGSYFTSFYGKPYTDADAALQELREENNLLRSMINNEIGAYIFDLDPDASQRYDDYIHNAYETPEGAIYRMRQAISWVTTAEGVQITDPKDRLRRLNQIWADDTKREAKYEALHESRMLFEEEMSQLPAGAPYELKEQILQRYWDRNDAINSNKDYVTIEDSPEWNPVNKPEEKILDHYRYNWFKDLRTLLAPYDPTAESRADYLLRKETWEKELPKYAAQLAKTYKESIQRDSIKLFPMLGWGAQVQTPVEEAPGVTLADRIIQQLMAESNPEGMDNYYKKNDTINEALGWAWDELYANKYWEMIDGLTGDERTIAINRFHTLYPASSITPQMLAEKVLSHPTYAKRGWTQAQLVSAYLKAGYMDIDESREASQSDGEKKVSEVFDYLGWADPGKEKSALQDKIEELGGSEVAKDLQLLYTSGGSTLLAQPKNAERLDALLKAVKYAVVSLGIEQPKDAELTIRVEAKDQNELYQSKAKETLGADIFEISSVYYGLSYSGQKQFRDTYPDDYKRILALSKFKDAFGEMYPLWKSFYDPNGKSSSSGESGTGTSTKKKTTSTSSKTKKWEYPLRDDFPQMGKRYSLDFRKLISGYYVGKAGVAGKPVWPQEMMDALSEMFFKEATEAMEAGEELSTSAETYLNSLSTTHPDWKGPIDEIKRIIKENASQGVAGGKWVAETQ